MDKTIFDQVYDGLNREQQQVVDTLEGPVVVIAGPGTGKTQVLSARIANILVSTDTKPDEILCLTYTDAGSVAMRERVLRFVGPKAYRVNINTFHSFCSKVIQEQPDYFGAKEMMVVSGLEQYKYLQQIIDSFPPDHPLARPTGDMYYEAGRLQEIYGIMKQEGLSSQYLSEQADAWIDSMAHSDEFLYKRNGKATDGTPYKKGDVNQTKLREATRRAEQFKAAVATFDIYQSKLKADNRFDFADMIMWVLTAFRESPEMRSLYQDRYHYILVDEAQDTSGAQFELLTHLVGGNDQPNLLIVGDDDQSIFRFQGASVENLMAFQERFKEDITVITLTENYRSTQSILDTSAGLIANNIERFAASKALVAMNPNVASLDCPVSVRKYARIAHETADIAQCIEQMIADGIYPGDIAVLYRNHRQAEDLIRYFTSKGISVLVKRKTDILKEPVIENFVGILRYLAEEIVEPHSGEKFLFKMIHGPWFQVEPLALASFTVAITGKRSTNGAIINNYWREELLNCETSSNYDNIQQVDRQAITAAGKTIEQMIQAAATMPIRELLHFVVTRMGVLSNAMAESNQTWNIELLTTLFDFVRDEITKEPLSLNDIVKMLDEMKSQEIALPAEKLVGAEDGVNLMTCHGAKGLEWDHVFLIGCTSNVWDAAPRNRTYTFPPNVSRNNTGSEEEESRRLMYVAMTRAKLSLVLSYAVKDGNERNAEPSRFVIEVGNTGANTVEGDLAGIDKSIAAVSGGILEQLPGAPLFNPELVGSMIGRYSMSVTHLNDYLKCPTAFYFKHILKVPTSPVVALIFGSAIHYALEQIFVKMLKSGSQTFSPVATMFADFNHYMLRRKNDFTDAEFTRLSQYGEKIISEYYDRNVGCWPVQTAVEESYQTTMAGIPVNGRVDRREIQSRKVLPTDYKTGKYENARKKLQSPNTAKAAEMVNSGRKPLHEDVWGGDYWRQAVFTKLLIEESSDGYYSVDEVVFDFIQPDKNEGTPGPKHIVTVTDEDKAIVAAQTRMAYDKIKNNEFDHGCADPECEWCQFVAQYQEVVQK